MAYAFLTPVVERLRRLTGTGAADGGLLVANDGGEQQEATDLRTGSHWEPYTNGDVENPEVYFSNGDVMGGFVAN